jgi:hypothetical protein
VKSGDNIREGLASPPRTCYSESDNDATLDDDEIIVLVIAGIATILGTYCWVLALQKISRLGGSRAPRWPLWWTPIFCLTVLGLVLWRWSAHEVREAGVYQVLFLALGAAWLAGATWMFQLLGLSFRGDALERHNPAAVVGVCGAWIAVTLCYTGANIGEGPTIWTTIGPAFLATAAWFVLWFILEISLTVSESITVDRDVASAVRLAGWLIAEGIVLGAAVAGNWRSVDATWRDFWQKSWPALPLLVAGIVAHRWLRPSRQNPQPCVAAHGINPALLYLFAAILAVWMTFHQ